MSFFKFQLIFLTCINWQIFHYLSVGSVGNPCRLPPDAGNCRGICPRWYYDARLRSCRPFNYGCCGGNANNFKTRQLCESICREDRCRLFTFHFHVNRLSHTIKVFKNYRLSFCFVKIFVFRIVLNKK